MAIQIGSRGITPDVQQTGFQPQQAPNIGPGIGAAMAQLGGQAVQYSQWKLQKKRQEDERTADTAFERTRGETERQILEMQRSAPETAAGFTDQANEFLRKQQEQFLASLPPDIDPAIREHYNTRFESLVQNGTTQAFTFEYDRTNQAFVRGERDALSDAQTRIYEDPDAYDIELGESISRIQTSTLSAPEKEALIDEVTSSMGQTVYQRIVQDAIESGAPVRDPNQPGLAPVAPGLTPPQAGLLAAIASPESGGDYTIMYGGQHFSDFSDHPQQYTTITEGPHKGEKSSAAGKYQFTYDTWVRVRNYARSQGIILNDFSPVNQDRGALIYAEMVWNEYASANNLSQNLDQALSDPTMLGQVRRALAGAPSARIWAGLGEVSDQAFAEQVRGGPGPGTSPPPAGTPGEYNPVPDAVSDPRFANMPFDTRMQLTQQAQASVRQSLADAAARQRDLEVSTHASLANAFENGEPGSYEAIQNALSNNTIRDVSLRDDLRTRVKAEDAARVTSEAVRQTIAAGGTMTSDDEKEVMTYYESTGVMDGLRRGDAAAIQTVVANTNATQYLPKPMLDALMAQMGSSNQQQAVFAAEALRSIYQGNPQAFAQFATEDQTKQVVALSTIMDTASNPAEALERQRFLNDPATATERRALLDQANDTIKEMDLDGVITDVAGGEAMPATPFQAERLRGQYLDLWREGYVRFRGDEDAAEEFAGNMIKNRWSADPISGALMEFSPLAPGANVRSLGELGRDWIEESVRSQLISAGTGINTETPVALIADAQTKQEFAQGLPPTYTTAIITTDENGLEIIDIPMEQDARGRMAPRRISMEPTQHQLMHYDFDLEMSRINSQIEGYLDEDDAERKARGRSVQDESWNPREGLSREEQEDLARLERQRNYMQEVGPEGWSNAPTLIGPEEAIPIVGRVEDEPPTEVSISDPMMGGAPAPNPPQATPPAATSEGPLDPMRSLAPEFSSRPPNRQADPETGERAVPPAREGGKPPKRPRGNDPLWAAAQDLEPVPPAAPFDQKMNQLIEDARPLFGDPSINSAIMRRLTALQERVNEPGARRSQLARELYTQINSLPNSEGKRALKARLIEIMETM